MVMPAAAAATPLHGALHTPQALLGLDVGGLVGDIIKKLVDLVIPDFASHWATALVSWLVAIPDVTDARAYPHLNAYRGALVGVGFALLSVSVTITALQAVWGAPVLAPAAKRTIVAAGMLVLYPKLLSTAILGLNILTGSMVTSHLVTDGVDKMLGSALVLAAVTGGVSLGLAVGAATVCMYFIAGLMVIKIGLTSIEALLMLAGALVWGLYPMPGTAWLARAWTTAAVTVALIPIAWALIFATGALLTSDSLIWATGAHGGLPTDLQQIVKPFSAVACFWVAFKAPAFLLAAGRAVGIHPAMVGPTGRGGGGRGASRGPLSGAVQTNRDRFGAILSRTAGRLGPITASARNRAGALRTSAAQTARQAAGPALAPMAAASVAAGSPLSGRGQVFDDSLTTARRGAHAASVAAKGVVAAPFKANKNWRNLAAEGAKQRQLSQFANGAAGQPQAASSTATPAGPNGAVGGAQRRPETLTLAAVAAVATPAPSAANGRAVRTSETTSSSGANDRQHDRAAAPVAAPSTTGQSAPSAQRKPAPASGSPATTAASSPARARPRAADAATPAAKPGGPAMTAPRARPSAATPAAPTATTTNKTEPVASPRASPRRPLNEPRPEHSAPAPNHKPASPPTRRPS
jgi:hypothetical protein